MTLKHFLTLALLAVLPSCGFKKTPEPTLTKSEPIYKNPYTPGSYDHFKAEKSYPKTYNVWTNVQLLPETNASNSSLKIDLKTQRGLLMKDGEVVLDYPISSGTRTHPTPPGNYKILEKIVDKSSNKYGRMYDAEGNLISGDANAFTDTVPEGGKFVGAPMRYWMRLTWDGVGHHVGPVPRYPASHSCVRGPSKTMPTVFSKVDLGTSVVIE